MPNFKTGESETLLRIDDVHVEFGGVRALDGPSFDVQARSICGLIGPNGAGKTTLFNCISRLYETTSGSIEFNGVDILALRRDQVVSVGLARTFQNIGLFESSSVLENVMCGAYSRGSSGIMATVLGLPLVRRNERKVRTAALEILDSLRLSTFADHLVSDLPYGTQKRIEMARALMSEPRMLILDEPANGLTHAEVDELSDTILRIRDEHGVSILLVEHHMGLVMKVSDRVVVLNFGRKIAEGTPADVQANPAVVEAYLGVSA